MKRIKWMVGGVLAVVAAGTAVYWGLSDRPGAMPAGTMLAQAQAPADGGSVATPTGEAAAPPLTFTAAEVVLPERGRMSTVLEFSGPLVAPRTAVLRAKASGTLLALHVAEGDRVRAGQVLGRIDMAETAARAAERSAQVAAARAALAQAERTHLGNEGLAAQGFIAGIALENSRATVASARAALEAAQASLQSTQLALREAELLAPIAGIVARRQALPGEKVSAEQPLLTLVDLSGLELAAQVGTHEVARLAPGMPVQVWVEGVSEPLPATLARIAPAAEPGTRSIGVTIALTNTEERLRAGQYALARLTLLDGPETLLLPAAAVQTAGGEAHVWVISEGRLARRGVVTGRRDAAGGRVEVLQGLEPGATVLGARFDNLREGALATVLPERAAVNLAAGQGAAAYAVVVR
jgi:RND family efflux transporter MFP subunit